MFDLGGFLRQIGIRIGVLPPTIIHMACQRCGSVMEMDCEKQMIYCPYCGSKKLVIEDGQLTIERIRAETKLESKRLDIQKEQMRIKEERKDTLISVLIGVALFIFLIILLLFL